MGIKRQKKRYDGMTWLHYIIITFFRDHPFWQAQLAQFPSLPWPKTTQMPNAKVKVAG